MTAGRHRCAPGNLAAHVGSGASDANQSKHEEQNGQGNQPGIPRLAAPGTLRPAYRRSTHFFLPKKVFGHYTERPSP